MMCWDFIFPEFLPQKKSPKWEKIAHNKKCVQISPTKVSFVIVQWFNLICGLLQVSLETENQEQNLKEANLTKTNVTETTKKRIFFMCRAFSFPFCLFWKTKNFAENKPTILDIILF